MAMKGVEEALCLSINGLVISDTFNHVAGVFRSPRSLIVARNKTINQQTDVFHLLVETCCKLGVMNFINKNQKKQRQ